MIDKLKEQIERRRGRDKIVRAEELQAFMREINVPMILTSLNIKFNEKQHDNQIDGFCPDHEKYCGRVPDKMKWTLNVVTGKTWCFTEHRASNILTVAKNILGLKSQRQAMNRLLNGKELIIQNKPKFAREAEDKIIVDIDKQKKELSDMQKVLDKGYMNKECLDYFARDGITEETLRKFGVCVCTFGKYQDRAIIPFLNKDWKLIGFIGIDYLGKQEWIKRKIQLYHKLYQDKNFSDQDLFKQVEKRYSKTLYNYGFKASKHLYGYYENESYGKGVDELVLVQGQRDCLKLMQEGIPCVSIHGSHLSEEQTIMVQKLSDDVVYLGFDMDEAGNNACKGAYKLLKDKINHLYVLNFPDKKDPKKFNKQQLLSFIQTSKSRQIRRLEDVRANGI